MEGARVLAGTVERPRAWSRRRTLAFVGIFNLVAWAAIGAVIFFGWTP